MTNRNTLIPTSLLLGLTLIVTSCAPVTPSPTIVHMTGISTPPPEIDDPFYLSPALYDSLPEVVPTPFLGIYMLPLPGELVTEEVVKEGSVYVEQVMAETAASGAGIQRGDVIVGINIDGRERSIRARGKRSSTNLLKSIISGEGVGSTLRLEILRGKERVTVETKLRERRRAELDLAGITDLERTLKGNRPAGDEEQERSPLLSEVRGRELLPDLLSNLSHLREKASVLDSFKVSKEGNPLRLPIVNYLFYRPTDSFSASLHITEKVARAKTPFDTVREVSAIPSGGGAGGGADDRAGGGAGDGDDRSGSEVLQVPEVPEKMRGIEAYTPEGARRAIEYLQWVSRRAAMELSGAFSVLTPGERRFVINKGGGIIRGYLGYGEGTEEAGDSAAKGAGVEDGKEGNTEDGDDNLTRLLKASTLVRYGSFSRGAMEISRLGDPSYLKILAALSPRALHKSGLITARTSPHVSGDLVGVIESPEGDIIIGGVEKTVYKEGLWEVSARPLAIIDLGGDDTYLGKGFGTGGKRGDEGPATSVQSPSTTLPVSILIDLGGDDRYLGGDIEGGTFSIGLLLDKSGDDMYISDTNSQGSAIFGNGLLFDLSGDDLYIGETLVQGTASFGLGILKDYSGDDIYLAKHLSQGVGLTGGVGALIDNSGGDLYLAFGKYHDDREEGATQSMSQGFGLGIRPYTSPLGAPGGVGLLLEGEGNDKYITDYFGQGASYWHSLGLLRDLRGDDLYISGRYSQGTGIHSSIGALIDDSGNDDYSVRFGVALGTGHDFGIGLMADLRGRDSYSGGWLSLGAATCGSLGLFFNGEEGGLDKDLYTTGKASLGHSTPRYGIGGGKGGTDLPPPCGSRGIGVALRPETGVKKVDGMKEGDGLE